MSHLPVFLAHLIREPRRTALFLALLLAVAGVISAEDTPATDDIPATEDIVTPQDAPITAHAPAFLIPLPSLLIAEDPSQVLDIELRDSRVEFYLDGFWNVSLTGGVEAVFTDGVGQILASPPVLKQEVDLSAWILIDDRWYFEASFAEGFDRNTFALGYMGGENEPVREIRVGNSRIVFPDGYPWIHHGGGDVIAPGVSATFAGNRWQADALVRLDSGGLQEKRLVGMNELERNRLPLTRFTAHGRFFLPDALPDAPISVYIQDDRGQLADAEGRRWRLLNPAEYRLDRLDGTITLPASAAVAVSYTGTWHNGSGGAGPSLQSWITETRDWFNSLEAGSDAEYGLDASADSWITAIAGETVLLLHRTGRFSPFRDAAWYPLSAAGGTVSVVYGATGVPAAHLEAAVDSEALVLRRRYSSNPLRSAPARYPLSPEDPLVYSPGRSLAHNSESIEARIDRYTPVIEISLGKNVIAGTITVLRNGIPESAFSFDPASGLLYLAVPAGNTDDIIIRWMDSDPGARSAVLRAAAATRFRFGNGFSAAAAASVIWTADQEGFSDRTSSIPGSLLGSTEIRRDTDRIKAGVKAGFEYATTDTSGLYRIDGMDSAPAVLYPAANWYTPLKANLAPLLDTRLGGSEPVLSAAGRRPVSGETETSLPSLEASGSSGRILVLDSELTAEDDWIAGDIRTAQAGFSGRSLSSIALTLRTMGTSDNYRLYVQISAERSAWFDNPDAIITRKITPPAATGAWVQRHITLTDEERGRLDGPVDIRLVIVGPESGVPVRPVLHSGRIQFQSIQYSLHAEPSDPFYTAEIRTGAAASILQSAWSDPVKRFNRDGQNSILTMESPAVTPSGIPHGYTASRLTGPVPLTGYSEAVWFVYRENLPDDAVIRLQFLTADGTQTNALSVEFNASVLTVGTWHRISAGTQNGTASLDRASVPDSLIRVHRNRTVMPALSGEGLAIYEVVFPDSLTDPFSFRWHVDEVHLYKAENRTRILAGADLDLSHPGSLVSSGPGALFADPYLRARAEGAHDPSTGSAAAVLTGESGLVLAGISLGVQGAAQGGTQAALSTGETGEPDTAAGTAQRDSTGSVILTTFAHSILWPAGPVTLKEQHQAGPDVQLWKRENSLQITKPFALSLQLLQHNQRSLYRGDWTGRVSLPALTFSQVRFENSTSVLLSQEVRRSALTAAPDQDSLPYGDIWIESTGWFTSPGEADAIRRSARLAGKHSLVTRALAVNLDWQGEGSYRSLVDVRNATVLRTRIETPFRVSRLSITPWWERSISRTDTVVAGGNWSHEFSSMSESLSTQTWFYRTLPFADLADPGIPEILAERGAGSAGFVNRYGIRLARPSTGSPADLYLPVGVTASIGRDTRTTGPLVVQDRRDIDAMIWFSFINMFGSWGTLNLTDLWQEDELSSSVQSGVAWDTGYRTWHIETQHAGAVLSGADSSIRLQNTWRYQSPDISGRNETVSDRLSVVWKRPARSSILHAASPYFKREVSRAWRENKLSLDWSSREAEQRTALEFDHVLTAAFGEHWEIHCSAGTRMQRTPPDILVIGITAAIGATLKF